MTSLKNISAYLHERSRDQIFTLLSFGFLTGWVISLPYEGPVFYGYIAKSGKDLLYINSYNLFFLAAGLLGGVAIRLQNESIKKVIQILLTCCLLLSLILPFLPFGLWPYMLPALSLTAGVTMTLHGHQVRNHFPRRMWQSVASDIMILACIIVIPTHIIVNNFNVFTGWLLIEAALATALFASCRIENRGKWIGKSPSVNQVSIIGRFWLLFIFIFIVTINAGIMFQMIYPSFAQYETLVSIYTNLPYLAAVIICAKIYRRNKFNLLYVGLALWGMALLMFSNLPVSYGSFFLIIGFMLFACGIFDFFWWSIMTTSFGYVKNPATMFGAVLSINVLGSWAGGMSSKYLLQTEVPRDDIITMGLVVVMFSMVLLVPLRNRLSSLLVDNEFLEFSHWNETASVAEAVLRRLSARELEVFGHLMAGMRDKDISAELNISLSTVKTHNRKIYNKLEVKNRAELRRNFR
jgi:DNA-binding CsgD family transcriptional regulator